MKQILKKAGLGLLGLFLCLAVGAGVLVTLINPNDFRDDISRVVRKSAGVELQLGGKLSWRLFPVLGFGANDVGLALRPGAPTLVHVKQLTLGLKLLPLFSKKIQVDSLEVDGLKADLLVDAKGVNNWAFAAVPGAAATGSTSTGNATVQASESPSVAPGDKAPAVRISYVSFTNSTIHYINRKAGQDYRIELPSVQLENVNLQKPFPVTVRARVQDDKKLDAQMELRASVQMDMAARTYSIAGLQLTSTLAGIMPQPIPVTLTGKADYNQVDASARAELTSINIGNIKASAQVDARDLSATPHFNGSFQTGTFNLKTLLKTLGQTPPVTRDSDAMTRVQASARFSGTPSRIDIKPLTLKLDDSTLTGSAVLTNPAKPAVAFNLQLDHLDSDAYLPPEKEKSATPAAASADAQAPDKAAAPLLPVEPLRNLDVNGHFSADEITVKKIPVRDLRISLNARDGEIHLDDLAANLMQGSMTGNAMLDLRPAEPEISTAINLQNLELADALQLVTSKNLLSGRSSLKLDTRTQGNDVDTLLRQALGQLDLKVADAVLHGVNLNQIVVNALQQKLGDFAVLMPDYKEKLPKALKDDTNIRNLLANMKVEKGHLITPAFNADTGEGHFSANGDIDLLNKGFDYHFGVTLSSLDKEKYLREVEWPVRCKGSLDTPASSWCRPDMQAIGTILQKAATRALRDKGARELGKKIGVENADQADLQEKLKAEQEKAKQKLNEKLNKQLDKLFGR